MTFLMTQSRRLFLVSRQNWWLAVMLLALHGGLGWGITSWWAKALLLTHFGLFLLWQPVWQREGQLSTRQGVMVLAVGIILAGWSNWWLMAFWLSMLTALIAGNVPGVKRHGERYASLLAAIYLLAVLLLWVVPHLFEDQQFSPAGLAALRFGLPIPVLAIFFFRPDPLPTRSQGVDMFYSLLMFLLLVSLVLGSFVIKQTSQGDYLFALAQTLLAVAGLLILASWLWDPRGGFSGIGQVLSRYLLSVGLPFEQWMHSMANLADRESNSEKFLLMAAHEMIALPWLAGVRWAGPEGDGSVGEDSPHPAEFEFHRLKLTLYSRQRPAPGLLLHMKLLARLLADFYEAKRRERQERENAYTQAIYETGSRLAHDVKNLLQSLTSLCSAVETSEPEDAEAMRALMQRQLPQITQRLQMTLDKLAAPGKARSPMGSLTDWWAGLKRRGAEDFVEFAEALLPQQVTIPVEVFDGVADNLLQNALEKRKAEPRLGIRVSLSWSGGKTRFTVCDDGTAIPEVVAGRLFVGPVPSSNGLGIGLYQVANLASQYGYRLGLSSNANGQVCFELSQV